VIVLAAKPGETISVTLDGGKTADLSVEEFHPVEPSAYQWEAGWTCYDLNADTEYFVSVGGDVYVQPENRCVGFQKDLRAAAERLERLMEFGHEGGGIFQG
jgi:hypothetical protein